jgi:hypothetical protein
MNADRLRLVSLAFGRSTECQAAMLSGCCVLVAVLAGRCAEKVRCSGNIRDSGRLGRAPHLVVLGFTCSLK